MSGITDRNQLGGRTASRLSFFRFAQYIIIT